MHMLLESSEVLKRCAIQNSPRCDHLKASAGHLAPGIRGHARGANDTSGAQRAGDTVWNTRSGDLATYLFVSQEAKKQITIAGVIADKSLDNHEGPGGMGIRQVENCEVCGQRVPTARQLGVARITRSTSATAIE